MNTHCFCFTYLNNLDQLLYISLNYFMVSTVKFWSKIYLKLICLCCSYSSCFLFIFMWIFNSFSTISSPNNIICPLYSILTVLEIMFISLAFFFLQVLKVTSIALYFKLYSLISIYTILETSLVLPMFNLCMFFHVHLCGWACMFTSFLLCDVVRRQSLLLCLRCHLPFSIETRSLSRLKFAKLGGKAE